MFLKEYLSNNIIRTKNKELDNLTLDYVSFDKLVITESQKKSFDKDHLLDILSEFHPAIARAPSVVLIDNKYVIWDGQHTALAFYLNGVDNIPCMIYKTDNLSFIGTTCVEKFDTNQLAHLLHTFMLEHNCNTIDDVALLLQDFDKTA